MDSAGSKNDIENRLVDYLTKKEDVEKAEQINVWNPDSVPTKSIIKTPLNILPIIPFHPKDAAYLAVVERNTTLNQPEKRTIHFSSMPMTI